MTQPWLVGLDIDGTILLPDESLSPRVADSIARLRDAGHVVMLATGRSWSATWPVMERLEITPEYAVCSNGAVIMRREGKWVRDHVETFDPREVLSLLQSHLPDARYMVELADGHRLYTDGMDDWNLRGADRVEFDDLAKHPVCRVVVVSPGHDEADFHRIVSEAGLNEVSYAIGWTAWLDIAPKGVDKGTALERVRQALDVPGERVLVVGDGRNDVGMFTWVDRLGGRAVSMGQAPDEVHAAANERTGDVVDGGLADVLDSIDAPVASGPEAAERL